jgi:hypothetical protein
MIAEISILGCENGQKFAACSRGKNLRSFQKSRTSASRF